jgi:hypothetical protein
MWFPSRAGTVDLSVCALFMCEPPQMQLEARKLFCMRRTVMLLLLASCAAHLSSVRELKGVVYR